jgi:hypothetical protein
MMKIWKGKELEGVDKGVQTMFVSGSTLFGNMLLSFLPNHTDCKRLYLGGGRVDVEECFHVDELMAYCDKHKIDVIMETSFMGFVKHTDRELLAKVDKTIVRIDQKLFDMLSSTDQLKIDSGKNVYTVELEKMIHTDLSTLNKDMFASDVLVYDESEEKK